MQLLLDPHDVPAFWTLVGHAGIEKHAQTQTPRETSATMENGRSRCCALQRGPAVTGRFPASGLAG